MVAGRKCHERYIIERAVDFVGRSENERDAAAGFPDQLQEVQRPSRIYGEIVARISEAGRDGNLSGEMKYRSNVTERLAQTRNGLHVSLLELHPRTMRRTQPAQVVLGSRPAEIVVDPDRAPAAQQPVGQIGSDETGTAGDESRPAACRRDERNAHSVSPRAASAARASPTRRADSVVTTWRPR